MGMALTIVITFEIMVVTMNTIVTAFPKASAMAINATIVVDPRREEENTLAWMKTIVSLSLFFYYRNSVTTAACYNFQDTPYFA